MLTSWTTTRAYNTCLASTKEKPKYKFFEEKRENPPNIAISDATRVYNQHTIMYYNQFQLLFIHSDPTQQFLPS